MAKKKNEEYIQLVEPVSVTKPDNFTGSSNDVYTYDSTQAGIKNQMNQNSQLWWDAHAAGDTARMNSLEQANKALAGQLGSGVTFNPSTGYWSGAANAPVMTTPTVTPSIPSYSGYGGTKPTYTSQYAGQIDAKLDAILNRQPFTYDAETDPLYQQYKAQYNREGNRAMQDTMANAATFAGGMNSYAMTAAQQANDYYAAQLADKIPELYQLAYSMYMDDINLQAQDLSLLQSVDNNYYNRYRDEVGDWYADRDFDYNAYRDSVNDSKWSTEFDYNQQRDQLSDQRYQQEWDYAVNRDQVEDQRYDNETAYERAMTLLLQGIMPDSTLLAQAGISSAEAQALQAASQQPAKGSGTSGKKNDKEPDEDEETIDVQEQNYNILKDVLDHYASLGETEEIMKELNTARNSGEISEVHYQRLLNKYRSM